MPADPATLLPWTFLAGPVCALYQGAERLSLTPEEAKAHDNGETMPGGDPPLFAAVRRKGKVVGNPMFKDEWERPWPSGLQLLVRTWEEPEKAQFILRPDALVLRYPFSSGPVLTGVPALEALPPAGALYDEAFLLALDDVVDTDTGRGAFSINCVPKTGNDAKGVIQTNAVQRGGQVGAGVPSDWTVDVDPAKRTAETEFSWPNDELHVDLGWVRDEPNTILPPAPPFIAQWPCDPLHETSRGGWAGTSEAGCP